MTSWSNSSISSLVIWRGDDEVEEGEADRTVKSLSDSMEWKGKGGVGSGSTGHMIGEVAMSRQTGVGGASVAASVT